MKTSTATQTIAKPSHRDAGMGSPRTPQPMMNCPIGAMYWNIPTHESGMREAAAAKKIRGTAVRTPVPASSVGNNHPVDPVTRSPRAQSRTTAISAGTNRNRVSSVSPGMAPKGRAVERPRRRFTRP